MQKGKGFMLQLKVNSVRTTSAGDVLGETPIKSDRLELSASSAGDIKLEVIAKDIDIDISSSGDITISGETDMLKADLSSAGDLNAYDLKAREAEVSVSSAGDVDVYVELKNYSQSSSAGDINYKRRSQICGCSLLQCGWNLRTYSNLLSPHFKSRRISSSSFFLTLQTGYFGS